MYPKCIYRRAYIYIDTYAFKLCLFCCHHFGEHGNCGLFSPAVPPASNALQQSLGDRVLFSRASCGSRPDFLELNRSRLDMPGPFPLSFFPMMNIFPGYAWVLVLRVLIIRYYSCFSR